MGFFLSVEPDVKLFVEDLNPQGRKTILFVHGWPGNHKLFEYQFDVFPGMGCRCIGIDYRGFGKSDRPWTGYDYDQLSDDLLCVINKLQLNQFYSGRSLNGGANFAVLLYGAARRLRRGKARIIAPPRLPALSRPRISRMGFPANLVLDIHRQHVTPTPQYAARLRPI